MTQEAMDRLANTGFLAKAVLLGQGDAFARERLAEQTHPMAISVATGDGDKPKFPIVRDARERVVRT